MQLSVSGAGATIKVATGKVVLTAGVSLSVTLTVKLYVPDVAGVPLMAPVVALIDIHAGAPTSEYEYGVVPPPAEQLAPVYGTFTCAVAGNVQFSVTVPGATTKLLSINAPVAMVLSVAVTVKEKALPEALGFPVIVPAFMSNINPVGKAPCDIP